MKRLSILALICAITTAVWAVPARRGGIIITQPDGSELTVYQHGDEHFHWTTNEKGEWISLDKDGFYRKVEALNAEEIQARRMASPKHITYRATPLNIAPRGLVILVNFKDLAFETSKEEMDSMLTGQNYTRDYTYTYRGKKYNVTSQGSARQYFEDASFGQYNLQLDVVGPVTVSKNMADYGGNNSDGSDKNPEGMIKEACELVNDSVDYTHYDNDNDGYVDFVYVIYAGYGEADGGEANTIWPHTWYLYSAAGKRCQLDDKVVDLYACGNEMDFYTKHHTGIGTFCHEFSHVLGLPDLYDTNLYQPHGKKTFGDWSVMDHGPYNNDGNTPPTYSAYERFFMGWLTPRLITEPENITLAELRESQEALLISESDVHNLIGNDPNPTTFYLLENRQQTGWDEYLPGHGLMLTKVKYSYNKWYGNTVNNSANSQGVDLIEADGKTPQYNANGYMGKAKDLFPAGATSYTKIPEHAIEEIIEEDGLIHFKYKGGKVETGIEDVDNEQSILAIYNVLGQKQATTDIEALPNGTYIVVNATGSYKIVR